VKYKGVIFDLDGVICHTDKFHYQAWKAVADRIGVHFDETANNRLRGVSRMESLDIILEDCDGLLFSDSEKERLAQEKNEIYRSLLMQMDCSHVDEIVLIVLHQIREHGIKLAIGSSSKNAKLILNRIGLHSLFDAISDGNSIERSKPDPQVFDLAAEYIGLPASQCLIVEDARAGIEAAVAGGFDSVGIGDAAHDTRATYCISEFEELLNILSIGD